MAAILVVYKRAARRKELTPTLALFATQPLAKRFVRSAVHLILPCNAQVNAEMDKRKERPTDRIQIDR